MQSNTHNAQCIYETEWYNKVCTFFVLQELCNEMDSKVHAYTDVRNAIHRMLETSDVARGSSTEHSLCILEQKWSFVHAKMQEQKVKKEFLFL